MSCDPYNENEDKNNYLGGVVNIDVNDFAEQVSDYEYNILSKIITDLYLNPVVGENLYAEIIDNNGNLLYTIVFEKPYFYNSCSGVRFDYGNTELSKITLSFTFKNLIILAPNEDLEKDASAD